MTKHHHHEWPTTAAEPPSDRPNDEATRQRKHLALWLAVGGVMALIAVMWFILLPLQLSDIRLPNRDDLERWHVLKADQGPAPSLQESLDRLHQQLEKASANSVNSPAVNAVQPAAPVLDTGLLLQKLEAAAKPAATTTDHETTK